MNAINWRRAATYGVMWGLAVAAMEALALPLDHLSVTDLLIIESRFLPHMIISGITLASVTMLVEQRLNLASGAFLLLAFSLFACLVMWMTRKAGLEAGAWPSDTTYMYTFWSNIIYGGVFLTGYCLSARSERTRGLLMRAEIARQQSEAVLSAAQLKALQGQIDPAFLIRALVEVERRYSLDPAGADRVLDALVSFLRTAMPAVRSGASTLAAEVALATDYARVCSELEQEKPAWSIQVEGSLPDLHFPPLLLLPVLEQLAKNAGSKCRPELRVNQSRGRCCLTLSGSCSPGWLPADLLYRFQVGLRALFGSEWTLAVSNGAASPAFMLTLPLKRSAPILVPTPTEVSYG